MNHRRMKALAIAIVAAAPLGLVALVVWDPFDSLGVSTPHPRPVEVTRLGNDGWTQGWPVDKAVRYHQMSQGTKILPIAWFRALEPPTINPLRGNERLAAREYLSRFGFMYDPGPAKEDDLPIGFAVEENFKAPYLDPPVVAATKMVGLTCAACHTGRLDVEVGSGKTVGVLIEGGSAMINLGKFQEAVGKSLAYTRYLDDKFDRFVNRVLADPDCPPDEKENKDKIKAHVRRYVETGIAGQDYAKDHKLYPVEGGFSRTDALGLIGNRVFGLSNVDNQTVTDAPVNFPHLWDTAWFDWVQYNASIRMPMARNIGEALGVGAAVAPSDTLSKPYESTVRIDNLDWIESFLGGDTPLATPGQGSEMLQPPRWADFRDAVLREGKLQGNDPVLLNLNVSDPSLSQIELYQTRCQGCHLPPREKLRRELAIEGSPYWDQDVRSKKKFLKLHVVDLSIIGTDQNQAVNFYRRFAVVPDPLHVLAGSKAQYPRPGATQTISAEAGLYRVTSFLRKDYYDKRKFFEAANADERLRFDRYRTLPIAEGAEVILQDAASIAKDAAIDDVIRANLGYKARPLDGIWATPPFFHNSSVPNLYQILVPAENRDVKFYLGRTIFDPVKVGYLTDEFPGGFLMDTTLPGNSNGGHEFRNYSLEEFEDALKIDLVTTATRKERWEVVFQRTSNPLPNTDEEQWKAARSLTEALLEEVRKGVRKHIKKDNFMGIRGVIGPELTEAERWDLVAFLKSL